jgi:hypothetical protein
MVEIVRPKGFPHSEKEFAEMLQHRVAEVAVGKHKGQFSEWLLRGELGEVYNPTIALAFFPTPAENEQKWAYQPVPFYLGDIPRTAEEYWHASLDLPLPERVTNLESKLYKHMVHQGEWMLKSYSIVLMRQLLPSSMIVFSTPDASSQESAYLFAPSSVPPSAAYRHFMAEAKAVVQAV